jgi:hypothetical protein
LALTTFKLAKNDVYLNLLQANFSANSTKTQKKITEGPVKVLSVSWKYLLMDLQLDVAHPPAARFEMLALEQLICTLESFQGDADVPKDMGLVINILSSKLLPRSLANAGAMGTALSGGVQRQRGAGPRLARPRLCARQSTVTGSKPPGCCPHPHPPSTLSTLPSLHTIPSSLPSNPSHPS